ncbi:hypothetical protein N2152v2_007351 [Parachlorella kessleri]
MNRRRLFVERPVECGGAWSPRRLLQDGGACTAANCSSHNEAVHVVELDLVDKECVVMQDAWFDGPAIPPGKGGGGVLQVSSPLECCKACFEDKRCSVWTFCSQPRGCALEGPSGPPRQLPAGGCRLVTLPNFHPIVNSSTSFRVVGPDVPFTSGAPVTLTLPKIPHYHINPGVDLNNNFDYRCPTLSLRSDVCEVVGSAQDLARMCDADPQCKAFVYLPGGLDFKSAPVGVLKGGLGVDTIPLSALAVNPSTALFMKDTVAYGTPPGSAAGSGGGGKSVAVYIVVPIAAVVAAAGLALLVLVAWRLRSQKVASSDRLPAASLTAAAAGEAKPPPSGHSVGSHRSLQHAHSQQRQPQQQRQQGAQPPRGAAIDYTHESAGGGGAGTTWAAAGWQPGVGGKGRRGLGRDDSALEEPPLADAMKAGASRAVVSPADWTWLLLAAVQQQQPARTLQQQQQPRYQWDAPDSPVVRALLRRFGGEAVSSEGEASSSSGPSSLTPSSQEQHSLSSDGGSLGSAPGDPWPPQQPQQEPPQWAAKQRSQRQLPQQAVQAAMGAASPPVSGGLPPEPGTTGVPRPSPRQGGGGPPSLPDPDWVIQPEEVEVCRRADGSWWQLGSGACGTVYKGLHHGMQPVAVKVLPYDQADQQLTEELEKEVSLLRSCRDRHIVQLLGANLEGPAAMLVMEYMELGDLWRALPLRNSAGDRIFAWQRRGRRVALDVARGLHYLHSRKVVHLDLKSPNILLSRHGTAKLADVGVARLLARGTLSVHSGSGAAGWAWSAPEVLTGRPCCVSVDIYSFGVVLWEICTGEVPVRGGMRPLSVPGDCPQPVADLQARCTAEDPGQRPSAAELVGLLSALERERL